MDNPDDTVMDDHSSSSDENSSVSDGSFEDSDLSSFSESSSSTGSFFDLFEDSCFNDKIKALIESNDAKDKDALNQIIINMANTNNSTVFLILEGYGLELEVLNNKGQTFMHLAFYNDCYDVLYFMIGCLPDIKNHHINYTDCSGLSHLHIICDSDEKNTLHMVKEYLKNGADVNASFQTDLKKNQSGFTPLHLASSSSYKSESVMMLLLKYNANIDAVDELGRTALHLLCSMFEDPKFFSSKDNSVMKKIKFLLKSGCNVNAKDKQGNTPLHNIFLDNNFSHMRSSYNTPAKETWLKFKLLLRYGADVTATNNDSDTILHYIIKTLKPASSQSQPTSDNCIRVKIIKKILTADKNVNVNAVNCAGETPLQLAVSIMSVDIVKLLLNQNADISNLTLIKDGDYCFHKSILLPNLKAVKNALDLLELLLDKEFKLNFHDNLAFMRFLLHDVDYNSWIEILDTRRLSRKIKSFLENLLDYGSPVCIKSIFNHMIITILTRRKNHLKEEIIKRSQEILSRKKIADFHVDEEIYNTIYITNDVMLSHTNEPQVGKEISIMKSTFVKDNVTLYDIIVMHPFDIYEYIRDANFEELTREINYYKKSVNGHIAKCLVRNYIKKSASDFLRLLLSPLLPDLCCELISYYLSNEDILNVCFSVLSENGIQ